MKLGLLFSASILFCLVTAGMAQKEKSDFEKLEGTWEITAFMEEGVIVPNELVEMKYAKNSRFTINGQSISFISPGATQKHSVLFVLDEKATPKTIDLAGSDKTGSKGIYLLSDDTLLICFSEPGSKERPTEFSAKKGEPNLLLTLKRVKATSVPATPVKEEPQVALKDADMQKSVLGTWGHKTDEWLVKHTLNADGTFSTKRAYTKKFGKVFNKDVTSSGTWKLEDGVILCKITASTDKDMQNQIYSYRIRTLSKTELIAVDQFGQLRREWKLD